METQELKVVTVVAEALLEKRIVALLDRLGVTGYTVTEAHGEGSRGRRQDSPQGDNVKIEILCPSHLAEQVMREVAARYFEKFACVAWVSQAMVVAGAKWRQAPGNATPLSIVG